MIKKLLAITALLVAGLPTSHASDDVYIACSNLVYGYAYHRDNFNAQEFANLFTHDASLTVLTQNWLGRENIQARIEGMKNGSTTRHEMSTIFITPVDENHATGVSYAVIYSAPAGSSTVSSAPLIGEYHDEFLLTAEGWKIAKRVLTRRYTLEQ